MEKDAHKLANIMSKGEIIAFPDILFISKIQNISMRIFKIPKTFNLNK